MMQSWTRWQYWLLHKVFKSWEGSLPCISNAFSTCPSNMWCFWSKVIRPWKSKFIKLMFRVEWHRFYVDGKSNSAVPLGLKQFNCKASIIYNGLLRVYVKGNPDKASSDVAIGLLHTKRFVENALRINYEILALQDNPLPSKADFKHHTPWKPIRVSASGIWLIPWVSSWFHIQNFWFYS